MHTTKSLHDIKQIHWAMKYSSWSSIHHCLQYIFPRCSPVESLKKVAYFNLETKLNAVDDFSYVRSSEKYRSWPNMRQHSVYLPQMYLWSKSVGSVPFGYLETELKATGEYFSMFIHLLNIGDGPICIATFRIFSSDVSMKPV